MHETGPHVLASRRSIIMGSGALLLSGCSLRFQDGSHVPGPTATTPSDITPLQSVRAYLVSVMAKCSQEKTLTKPAAATLALHTQQLTRIDATLKGLGAPVASPTSFAPPTTSATSTSAAKPTAHASGMHPSASSSKPSPSSSSSTPAPPKPTAWTSAEFNWLTLASTFARISSHSRPLALSLAASSVASTMSSGLTTPWPPSATIPAAGATDLCAALEPAITASEWLVAHTHGSARTPLANNVNWLYAARSMASTTAPSSATASPAPVWTFSSPADAQTAVKKSLEYVMSACVTAAGAATTDHDCLGVLFVWTHAAATLVKDGVALTAFPGLTQ